MITKRYHFEVLNSTNYKAKELAEKGCEAGTLVTADMQNFGVGRRGRSWSSEKGTGIYMSMVLRPNMEIENISMITLLMAMTIAKVLKAYHILPKETPCIKWPNDIVINKKKICGILTELTLCGMEIDYVIVGIGINVSNQVFPEKIKETAGSILSETGMEIEKEELITEIWHVFKEYYQRFLYAKDFSEFREEYESCLLNKNKQVLVLEPTGNYEGIAMGVTDRGELIVNTGTKQKYVSGGEVSVRGIYGYV